MKMLVTANCKYYIMNKIYVFIAFLLLSISSTGQDLRNTEWVKIDAKRKDGSTILDASDLKQSSLEYSFKEATVTITIGGHKNIVKAFTVSGETLSIGNYLNYKIDILNSRTLVLTEIPNQEKGDDKLNTITFHSKDVYFEYLIQNNQIKFISDTLAQCNEDFSPIYKGENDINSLFASTFDKKNSTLTGYFIVSPQRDVVGIQIVLNEEFTNKEINKFKEILAQTSGLWLFPKGADSLYFRINFEFRLIHKNIMDQSVSGIVFILHPKTADKSKQRELSLQEKAEADLHFEKGMKFSLNGKDEKAIIEFQKATIIDSLYLDAYYNLAYLYLKQGDKKLACEILGKLKSLEQKQGEVFYKENCN
jgi:hypothetical protein